MRILETLHIRNFKSIRDQSLKLASLNIFIGGNGAGKSNLIEAFRFLRDIVGQNLAGYTALHGGADALLHFGRKRSPELEFRLEFSSGRTSNAYEVVLRPNTENSFVIWRETAYYHERDKYPKPYDLPLAAASKESQLREHSHICARQISDDLASIQLYHFHDTSESSPVKTHSKVDDNRFLRPQAENLAAFLYWLQKRQPAHFRNIEDTVRLIAPFFERFQLEPSRLNENVIELQWKEKASDAYFNASSFSDGTLRFVCLATLLLQPNLPAVVLLDEPELGLHPAAINVLSGLLSSASERTQVLVATQSVTLVNQFGPESVWAVDREDSASAFRNLASVSMSGWLDDYALGELWEKNVLGARPR